LALLAITAVGDSLIVGSGIVAYDPTKILGIMIGFAPVEDFAYAIVAIVLVPVIWNASAKRK
jgi:lycopene cyclase domain-containing protein